MKAILCIAITFLISSSSKFASGESQTGNGTVLAIDNTVGLNETTVALANGTNTTTTTTVKPTESTTTTTTVKPTDPTTAPTVKPTEPTSTTTTFKPTEPTTTTTTPKPCPTLAPVASTTALPATAAPPKERSFDGLSFIGGMVLTVGLLAIGVVGFQYYRSREPKYTTM